MDGLLAIEILLDIILAHHVAVDLLDCDRGTEVIAQEHRSERALKQERESFVVCVGGWVVCGMCGTRVCGWYLADGLEDQQLVQLDEVGARGIRQAIVSLMNERSHRYCLSRASERERERERERETAA